MNLTRRGLMIGGAAALTLGRFGVAEANAPVITMAELYDKGDFSEQARLFNGHPVALQGFMAPPLKADSKFFVLTNLPMAVCPFCSEVSEWPEDIVVVYTQDQLEVVAFDNLIDVTGTLDLGAWTDPETGFVSKVRLRDAVYKRRPMVRSQPLGFGQMIIGN
jgi:hypothetical protein